MIRLRAPRFGGQVRWLLRGTAVAIAVLGVMDPSIMLARRARQALVIATDEGDPVSLASAARLRELLDGEYDVRVRSAAADSRLAACGADERCVLVGGEPWAGGAIDARANVLAALRVEPPEGARVEIAGVTSPTATYTTAVGRLLVDVVGHQVAGAESRVDVLDGDIPVGHAAHRWTADGPATIPVEWWPIAPGPRLLSVRASAPGGGHRSSGAGGDDQINVGVGVESEPHNVLIYDARPSWASTFVRRAIEGDARLALRSVAGISPRAQVTEGPPFRLDEAALADAAVAIAGAPEDLTVRDVDLLERFVRIRGGSLVLLPDRRPTGPIARLLPARSTERLEPAPVQVGEWRASELLIFPRIGEGIGSGVFEVLAKHREDPVVVATPTGAGRIVISGAMDAWRYRDAGDAAFDRAWRSLIADAAAAGGRPIEVTVDRRAAQPADDVRVTALVRVMAPLDATVAVSATVACDHGQGGRMLRLWPTGDRRRFEGRFAASSPGTCNVSVSSSAPVVATATTSLQVRHDIRDRAISLTGTVPPFRVYEAGDETSLAGDVRRAAPAAMAPAEVRLMRSPWWIVPFAGCLGAEWWLRRRRGMR